MTADDARMRILEMIENGEISAEEGWQRLQELTVEEAGLGAAELPTRALPGDEDASSMEIIQPPDRSADAATMPDFDKWRNYWTIPLWIGVGVSIVFALVMAQAALAGSAFWALCASLPFALGVMLIAVGWGSRTARWLHLRVQQPPGESPQRIVLSFPLPLGLASLALHTFKGFIPDMGGLDLEEMVAAVGRNTSPENPVYINVDEGNGEKVEIYIG